MDWINSIDLSDAVECIYCTTVPNPFPLVCTKPHLTTFRSAVKQGPSPEEGTTSLRVYLLPVGGKF
jgi:hypothetical protein